MKIVLNTDGGARGNPGPAGIGFVIKGEDEKLIYSHGQYIGETTNNQAEYQALLAGLEWIVENIEGEKEIVCYLDSELVVRQLNGEYKMKNEGLKPLFEKIKKLIFVEELQTVFNHVPREKNKEADMLVNKAIDNYS